MYLQRNEDKVNQFFCFQYKCRKSCARVRIGCTSDTQNHICGKRCYEDCEPCTIIVKKKRTVCPHYYNVGCFENVDELTCEKPCKRKLPCGHKCRNKCFEPCGNCQLLVSIVCNNIMSQLHCDTSILIMLFVH